MRSFFLFFIGVYFIATAIVAKEDRQSVPYNYLLENFYQKNYSIIFKTTFLPSNYNESLQYQLLLSLSHFLSKNFLPPYLNIPNDETRRYNDYIHFLRLKVLSASSSHSMDDFKKEWDFLHFRSTNTSLLNLSYLEKAKFYLRIKKYDNALNTLRNIQTSDKKSLLDKEIKKFLIELHLETRNIKALLNNYREYISYYPQADSQSLLWNKIQSSFSLNLDKNTLFLKNPQQHLQYLHSLLLSKNHDLLQSEARKLAKNSLSSSQQQTLQTLLAQSYIDNYQHAMAIPLLQELRRKKRDPKHLSFSIIQCYEYSKPTQAIKLYKEFIKNKSSSKFTPHAYYRLLKLSKRHLSFEEFNTFYTKLTYQFPQTNYAKQAHWEYHWTLATNQSSDNKFLEKLKQLTKNDVIFQKIHRVLLHLKKEYKLESLVKTGQYFPINYEQFSMLSRSDKKKSSYQFNPSYEWLYNSGLGSIAYQEVSQKYSNAYKLDFDLTLDKITLEEKLYYYTNALKSSKKIIKNIQEKSTAKIPQNFLLKAYPLHYWKDIEYYAKKYKLDPYILLSLIRETSQFNRNYTYKARDKVVPYVGLCSFNIALAKEVSTRLGKTFDSELQVYQPSTNIHYTAYYISRLQTLFHDPIYFSVFAFLSEQITSIKIYSNTDNSSFENIYNEIPYQDYRSLIKNIHNSYMMYLLLYV